MRESAKQDPELNSFSDIEILELVLSYGIRRKDTNPLAHRLLDRFGSLYNVFYAPAAELCKVYGMTADAAEIISMASELVKWNVRHEIAMDTTEKAVGFFGSIRRGSDSGGVYAAFLDDGYELIELERLDADDERLVRGVVGSAFRYSAKHVVLAKMTEQFTDPKETRNTADKVSEALDAVGLEMPDFLVFSERGYYAIDRTNSNEFYFIPYTAHMDMPEFILCEILENARKKH